MLVALSVNARIADTNVSTATGSSCVPLVFGCRADISRMRRIEGMVEEYKSIYNVGDDFEKGKNSSQRRIRSLSCGQRQDNNEMNQSINQSMMDGWMDGLDRFLSM